MKRLAQIAAPVALLLTGFTMGCAAPTPQQTAQLPSPAKKHASSCVTYTGSRLCRDPYEISMYLTCDSFYRAIAQGDYNGPNTASCYLPKP